MVGDEPAHGLGEAAELLEQAAAGGRVAADLGELVVVERPRLAEDGERHGELPDVVQQAADGEVAPRGRRQAHLLADAGGEQRDAAGVLLRRGVALGEAHEQSAHAAAQVRLLGRHQVGGAEVADQRARGAAAHEVEHRRDADEADAAQLQGMALVERGAARPDGELREERHQQPAAASDDEQIGGPVGEGVGPQRAVGEHGQARHPEDEQHDRRRAAGLRDRRHQRGEHERQPGERQHADREHGLQHEQRRDPPRPPQGRERGEREQRRADRERRAAGQRDHAVGAGEHAGRRHPVHGQQRRCSGERRAEQDGAAVAGADAGDRHAGGDHRRRSRGDENRPEVRDRARLDLARAGEGERHERQGQTRGGERVASEHPRSYRPTGPAG
jgi:hypothetical protein